MCASTPSRVPGHRVHADEERSVDAALEVVDVLGPLVLDDVLAVRVELLGKQRVERPPFAGAVAVHDDDLGRAGGLRAAHGRVDLAGVEAAPLLVHRMAARDLLPPDDAGDALHVRDDEDLHDAKVIAPTTSPRLFRTGVSRNSSIPSTWPSAGPDRTVRAVLGLQREATAVGVGGAEETLGAALRDPARRGAASDRCRARSSDAPTSSGRARMAAADPRRRPGEQRGGAAQRRRERRHAAAVDRDLAAADQLGDPLAAAGATGSRYGCERPAVAPRRPRACPRACPSSCGRASRPAGTPAGRSRGRRRWRRRERAPSELLPAAQARRGATRRRSRSRRRRGRRSPRRTGSPGSASPTSGAGSVSSSPQRSPSVVATCTRCTASTTSPAPHGYPDRVHRRSLVGAGTARSRSMAASARPARRSARRSSTPGRRTSRR